MLFVVWYYMLVSRTLGSIIIPHLGFHEGGLEDIRDAGTRIQSTHGSPSWWTDDFPRMTLEDKTKRLKSIQIFETLNKKNKCDPAPTRWKEFKAALAEIFIPPDLDDLVILSVTPPKRHRGVSRLVKEMPGLIRWHEEGVQVWMEGSPLDQLVVITLEALQEDYLSISERLWALKVLRCTQSYLPGGDLKPIRSNPRTGPVCRGALELFLTEGLELTLVKKPKNYNLHEVIERVKLIMNIRNHFEDFEKVDFTSNFIEIYDSLLQTKSVSGKETLHWTALRCMQHMVIRYVSQKETDCVFHILNHISRSDAACRDRIRYHVAQNDQFGKIYQAMFNSFKYQAVVRPSVQEYFSRQDMDCYVGNLLLPLVGLSLIGLEHIKHIITSFKAQETALKDKTAELYGLDPHKAQKYREDQEFVIGILHKVSPYVDGLEELLDSAMPKPKDNIQVNMNHVFASENTNIEVCSICLDDFLRGQRVIKLKCSKPHKFHEQCINAHIITSETNGADVLCPSCRRHIHLPIPISQHTFE